MFQADCQEDENNCPDRKSRIVRRQYTGSIPAVSFGVGYREYEKIHTRRGERSPPRSESGMVVQQKAYPNKQYLYFEPTSLTSTLENKRKPTIVDSAMHSQAKKTQNTNSNDINESGLQNVAGVEPDNYGRTDNFVPTSYTVHNVQGQPKVECGLSEWPSAATRAANRVRSCSRDRRRRIDKWRVAVMSTASRPVLCLQGEKKSFSIFKRQTLPIPNAHSMDQVSRRMRNNGWKIFDKIDQLATLTWMGRYRAWKYLPRLLLRYPTVYGHTPEGSAATPSRGSKSL
ncbi:hypothetical protein F4861DRAFT_174174 [Xylaria intraflava]|nr:hypothetical protein F4861DRAFT_174174 [Xylaria intraflava]